MSLALAHFSGHSGPAAPPRPRKRPAEPATKAGPEQAARHFVDRLGDRKCRWPGAYCTWAENETLARDLDLTPRQVKDRLKQAERDGLVVRFTLPAFLRWLELVGVPDFGLDPAGPPNLYVPYRVVLVAGRLPARIRPEGLYGPLGLDITDVNGRRLSVVMGADCPASGAQIVPPLPIGSLNGNNEVKQTMNCLPFHDLGIGGHETPFGVVAETVDLPPTEAVPVSLPEPTPPATLSESDRAASLAMLSSPWVGMRIAGWWTLADADALPPEWAGKPPGPRMDDPGPLKPQRPQLSQGKPRRGVSGYSSPVAGVAPPRMIVDERVEAIRDTFRQVDGLDGLEGNDGLFHHGAAQLTAFFDAPTSQSYYIKLLAGVAGRLVPVQLLQAALTHALTTGGDGPPGAKFASFIKRHPKTYQIGPRMKKPPAGSP